ncbi:MAG TPA: hypothetical protein PKZ54_07680 [Syntrophorhabdaceae bacterium]|nr:hypothetical protein [Syntrophorhabdaceae bacterium]
MLLRIIIITIYIIISCSSPAISIDEFIVIISDKDTGRIISSEVTKLGETIILTWRNSLFNLEVTETYTIGDTFFEQTGVIFHDPYGKPEPVIKAEEIDDFYHTGGPFKVANMSRAFKKIVFRIGEVGNPVIKLKGKDINLTSQVGFGGVVIVEIKGSSHFK